MKELNIVISGQFCTLVMFLYMTLLVTLISFEAAHFVLELSYAQSPFYLC